MLPGFPTARISRRLGVHDPMAGTVARLATGAGERTLGRAGCAPAGRQTTLPEGLVSARPCDRYCLVARPCLYFAREDRQPRPPCGRAPARAAGRLVPTAHFSP